MSGAGKSLPHLNAPLSINADHSTGAGPLAPHSQTKSSKHDDVQVNLLINNIDVESDSYLAIIDPGRTKDVVGHIAQASTSQAADAVQAAHEAFHKWKRTPIQERIGLLEKAAKILDDEAGEIAPVSYTHLTLPTTPYV